MSELKPAAWMYTGGPNNATWFERKDHLRWHESILSANGWTETPLYTRADQPSEVTEKLEDDSGLHMEPTKAQIDEGVMTLRFLRNLSDDLLVVGIYRAMIAAKEAP